MSWRLVDGVPVPDAVGGHPALDFCNTRAGWGDPAPKEYLTGPHALVVWARSTGLLPPPGPVPSNEPPAHEPPAHEPPAHEPPAHEPPAHEPPAHEPPAHERL